MTKSNYLLFLMSFVLISSTCYASNYEIVTTPENADVFIYHNKSHGSPIKLGKTPLKLKGEDIHQHIGEDKTYLLKITKKGHDDYKVMMVKTKDVDVKMQVLLDINKEITTINKHDILMSRLFKVQRLIRASNFDDALQKLSDLEKDFEDFSIISELKGITYYMKKDINKALSMFRLAFSKNPKNKDAYKMKVYLEKKLGVDAEIN
jgi:tetratricopeptide (TPR) repeat protein